MFLRSPCKLKDAVCFLLDGKKDIVNWIPLSLLGAHLMNTLETGYRVAGYEVNSVI